MGLERGSERPSHARGQELTKDRQAAGKPAELEVSPLNALGNRFDRMEWAGAFGDLGTLIPFVLAYVSVMGLDPLGVLLAFGVCMVMSGLWYRTPFPVQPMKALGVVATTQAAQTAVITPQAVYGSGLVTGVLWLALGLTGATTWITHFVSRPVVVGMVLGLGLGFMVEGIKLMAVGWLLSVAVLVVALLLLSNRRVPAMFVVLIGGGVIAIVSGADTSTRAQHYQIRTTLPVLRPYRHDVVGLRHWSRFSRTSTGPANAWKCDDRDSRGEQ
jgi:Molybdate transporter of MFS superfamily